MCGDLHHLFHSVTIICSKTHIPRDRFTSYCLLFPKVLARDSYLSIPRAARRGTVRLPLQVPTFCCIEVVLGVTLCERAQSFYQQQVNGHSGFSNKNRYFTNISRQNVFYEDTVYVNIYILFAQCISWRLHCVYSWGFTQLFGKYCFICFVFFFIIFNTSTGFVLNIYVFLR